MSTVPIQRLTRADIEAGAESLRRPWHANFYAMYSSVFGGIVTDPRLMLIPADDHLTHRGDGVFETLKCVNGSVYAMELHLDRLRTSAEAIHLSVPFSRDAIRHRIRETLGAGGHRDALVRAILSRGPGGFGVSPLECPAPALYVIAYRLPPPFMEARPEGARAGRSRLPVKPALLAAVKTCNYLLNALMAREAAETGMDFVLGFDEDGEATESATENFGVVTETRALIFPRPGRLLEGITMSRVMELARLDVASGVLSAIRREGIRESDLRSAREILLFGTTKDVASVTRYEGRPVGDGQPGPIRARLQKRLLEDMAENPEMRDLCPVGGEL